MIVACFAVVTQYSGIKKVSWGDTYQENLRIQYSMIAGDLDDYVPIKTLRFLNYC